MEQQESMLAEKYGALNLRKRVRVFQVGCSLPVVMLIYAGRSAATYAAEYRMMEGL